MIRHRAALVLGIVACALAFWIVIDMTDPRRHDLRDFDGHEVGRLETAMWRSYYEHHQVLLFRDLTVLLQRQFHLPFWQSVSGGYHAARAAVVFHGGHSHADYERALPDLNQYYRLIRRASETPFDAGRAASLELDWWIVHRERAQHPPGDLTLGLARLQAEIYQMPEERFLEHAAARAEAMLLRDSRAEAGGVSEDDWRRIGELLDRSWTSLRLALESKRASQTSKWKAQEITHGVTYQ